MKILGIDPGLRQTGYGLIAFKNDTIKLVDYGVIKTDNKTSTPDRLLTIFNDMSTIIHKFNPHKFVIEDIFYSINVKTTIALGQARASAILAAASNNVSIAEYSTRKIKQALTGNGNSTKEQVQFMVKSILKIDFLPEPIDASDALATAICYSTQFRKI